MDSSIPNNSFFIENIQNTSSIITFEETTTSNRESFTSSRHKDSIYNREDYSYKSDRIYIFKE